MFTTNTRLNRCPQIVQQLKIIMHNTESEGSTQIRNLRAQGCDDQSAARPPMSSKVSSKCRSC